MNERMLEAIKKLNQKISDNSKEIDNIQDKLEKYGLEEGLKLIANSVKQYTIKNGNWFYNGEDTGIRAEGIDGEKGDPGNGIVDIQKTGSDGLTDIYTIYYENGKTSKYKVKNGLPGKDGKSGKDGKTGLPGRDGKDGLPGKDGKDGLPGRDGKDGITPDLKIGKVETSDERAEASIRPGKGNVKYLDLKIPRGPQGFMGFDGKINGYNKVEIKGGENVTIDQNGSIITINATGGSDEQLFIITLDGGTVDKSPAEIYQATQEGKYPVVIGFIDEEYGIIPINTASEELATGSVLLDTTELVIEIHSDKTATGYYKTLTSVYDASYLFEESPITNTHYNELVTAITNKAIIYFSLETGNFDASGRVYDEETGNIIIMLTVGSVERFDETDYAVDEAAVFEIDGTTKEVSLKAGSTSGAEIARLLDFLNTKIDNKPDINTDQLENYYTKQETDNLIQNALYVDTEDEVV